MLHVVVESASVDARDSHRFVFGGAPLVCSSSSRCAMVTIIVSMHAAIRRRGVTAAYEPAIRSFQLIAPEPHFADFQMGAWWTLTYTPPLQQQTGAYSGDHNNGVCLRVMDIYGMTISAVAFD